MTNRNSRKLAEILKENKEPIAQAVKDAAQARSKLMNLLKVDEISAEVAASIMYKSGSTEDITSLELQYVIDLFDAYISAGENPTDRRTRMGLFAENYGKNSDEVKRHLDYFGLNI